MPDLTCAEVDDRDLEAGYLAGRLTAEEAEAFEAHYFACERCWRALETALAIRAVSGPRRRRRVTVPALAAAATVVLAAGAGWWVFSRPTSPADDVLRGGAVALAVRVSPSAAGLTVAWPPRPQADHYRVRVFSAAGALLLERATADTMLQVDPPAGAAFLDVSALDPLLEVVAASELVPLAPR